MGVPLFLCLLFLMFTTVCGSGFNDDPNLDEKSYKENWMESIPDDKLLSAVTIPGTHQSLNLYDWPFSKRQVWTLEKQLKAGLRYFDIKVRKTKNYLYVGNWRIVIHKFDEILKILMDFLDKHSSETLILRVTLPEKESKEARQSIKNLTEKYEDKVWTKTYVPSMRNARKKIVFMQTTHFNIGTINHNTFVNGDEKFKDIEHKMKKIKQRLKEAKENCARVITLTSIYSTDFKPPKSLAKVVNDRLNELIVTLHRDSDQQNCLGIINMDFPSPELIQNIIEVN
uniref:Phosphatidylinositol-specific phospholipase C X domain-containing protein n=1 Tax=Esox lucius TaxID=8010 RepID=A0A6Q2WV84_ESOLU